MNSAREKPGRARLSVLEPALSEVEGCRSESKKATPSAGAGAARVGLTLLSVAFDVALELDEISAASTTVEGWRFSAA